MLPHIRLDRDAGTPLHQQLSDALRRMILEGGLLPGARLPPSRIAARELGISRNLVVLAYEQLQLEGYLCSAVGVGTWVPESLSAHLLRPPPLAAAEAGSVAKPRRLSRRGERMSARGSVLGASRPTLPLRPAAVAAEHFPVRTWLRLSARRWHTDPAELVHYGEVQGYRPLREALAQHLSRFRAVRVTPEQILVTAGSQQSLGMIARMLLDPGDGAAVEEPGYDGAIASFTSEGARVVPVPVDSVGLDLSRAEALHGVRVLYTTPSHQYPLGVTLSLERRLALLKWAQHAGCWIIEDDYDSEFRYESRPLPSLQGLDRDARVLYVGTFSKVLASALRLAYVVLPADLVEPFVRAREVTDHHPPTVVQAVLADFIAEGHLERHIARMRAIYAARREALRSALDAAFGGRFTIVPGDGGLHLTMLTPEVDDVAVARHAFSRGIDPQPLSAHYVGADRRSGLVLGFGGFPPERLAAAVDVLRTCIDEVGRGNREHTMLS